MTPGQKIVREVRVLHAVFVATWLLFIVCLRILNLPPRTFDSRLAYIFAIVSVTDIGIGTVLRSRRLSPALETLRVRPDDSNALAQWRTGNILGFVYAQTVTLFGFLLRFLGAPWNIAGIFFAVGLLLLLVWTPSLETNRP